MPVIRRKKSQVSTKSTATTTKAKGRAVQKKSSAPIAKTTRGRAKVTTVAKPSASKAVRERQVDPVTGFGLGTDSDVMIKEAMRGGATRPEVISRIKTKLPTETETGSPKPVANVFASVLKKRLDDGWFIESSWKLCPPAEGAKAKTTTTARKTKGATVTPISKKTRGVRKSTKAA